MSLDPSDVHPEHDKPTPENKEDWSEEQLEQYTAVKDADLEDEAQENRRELAAEEREALEALREATDDGPLTTTVEFGDAELEVTKRVSGELEQKFDQIADEQAKEVPRIRNIRDTIIDAILLVIVDDDEPDDDPYDFSSRKVWELYYEENGSEGLMDAFETVADPALSRWENLGNSRERSSPSNSPR